MENLARREYNHDVDQLVKQELQVARIPVVNVGGVIDSEVKTRFIGLLNGFTFKRCCKYWVVCGWMPMKHAKYIYEQYKELGIRAGGYCDNVSPEHDWVCEDPVFDKELLELRKKCSSFKEFFERSAVEVKENPESLKFVKIYHVDSLLGLCKLAEIIRDKKIQSEIIGD